MPEARGQMMPQGGVVEVMDGFWIRRAASPVVAAGIRRLHGFSDNKENIQPWDIGRRKRSPLPEWYPRTPLRDITVVVNALERRRTRVRAAAARQRNLRNESSPQQTSPLPQEMSVSIQPPSGQDNLSDISNPSPIPTATATSSTSSDHSLATSSTSSDHSLLAASSTLTSFSSTEHSTETNLLFSYLARDASAQPIEPGKKLLSSIDEIERLVLENVKRTMKGPAKKVSQTSTLLSMR